MSLSETTADKNNRFRDVNRTEKHGDGKEFLLWKLFQIGSIILCRWPAMEMNGNCIYCMSYLFLWCPQIFMTLLLLLLFVYLIFATTLYDLGQGTTLGCAKHTMLFLISQYVSITHCHIYLYQAKNLSYLTISSRAPGKHYQSSYQVWLCNWP